MRIFRRTESFQCHYGAASRGDRGNHAGAYCSAVEMDGAAPHWPRPQPKRGPCKPRSLRNAYNSGMAGSSIVSRTGLPLTSSEMDCVPAVIVSPQPVASTAAATVKKIAIAPTITHSGFCSPSEDADASAFANARATGSAETAAGAVCAPELVDGASEESWPVDSEFITDPLNWLRETRRSSQLPYVSGVSLVGAGRAAISRRAPRVSIV